MESIRWRAAGNSEGSNFFWGCWGVGPRQTGSSWTASCLGRRSTTGRWSGLCRMHSTEAKNRRRFLSFPLNQFSYFFNNFNPVWNHQLAGPVRIGKLKSFKFVMRQRHLEPLLSEKNKKECQSAVVADLLAFSASRACTSSPASSMSSSRARRVLHDSFVGCVKCPTSLAGCHRSGTVRLIPTLTTTSSDTAATMASVRPCSMHAGRLSLRGVALREAVVVAGRDVRSQAHLPRRLRHRKALYLFPLMNQKRQTLSLHYMHILIFKNKIFNTATSLVV